jgi:hypothetical protein
MSDRDDGRGWADEPDRDDPRGAGLPLALLAGLGVLLAAFVVGGLYTIRSERRMTREAAMLRAEAEAARAQAVAARQPVAAGGNPRAEAPERGDRVAGAPDPTLGTPGAEHKLLDALAGDWDVVVKFPVGPGKHREGKSTCEAKWALDGRFVRLEYASTFAGKPLTVLRYVGFDRNKGRYVEVHFESTHTDVMHSEGTASEDGKTITCVGKHIDTATGKEVTVRTVTTIQGQDAFTLDLVYADPDGTDAKTVTLTHTRKGKR